MRVREAFGVALITPRPTSFVDTHFSRPPFYPESAYPMFAAHDFALLPPVLPETAVSVIAAHEFISVALHVELLSDALKRLVERLAEERAAAVGFRLRGVEAAEGAQFFDKRGDVELDAFRAA